MTLIAPLVDIEELLVEWLTLRGVAAGAVSTELPSTFTKGDRRVKISRIGGAPTADHDHAALDRPNVQVDVYGTSPDDALTIAGDTIDGIRRLAGEHRAGYGTVSKVEPTLGLTWSPDPVTDAARYLFGFRVYIRPERTGTPDWSTLLDWTYSYDLADQDLETDTDPGDGTLVGFAPADPLYRGPEGVTLIPNRGTETDHDLIADPGWLSTWAGLDTPVPTFLEPSDLETELGDRLFGNRPAAWSSDLAILTAVDHPAFDWAPDANFPASFLNAGAGHAPPYTLAALIAPGSPGGMATLFGPWVEGFRDTTEGPVAFLRPDDNTDPQLLIFAEGPGTLAEATHPRADRAPHIYVLNVPAEGEEGALYIDGLEALTFTGPALPTLRNLTGPTGLYADGSPGIYWSALGVIAGALSTAAQRATLTDWLFDEVLVARHRAFYRATYRGRELWPGA